MVRYLEVRSRAKAEFIDITPLVREQVQNSGVTCGVCHLFVLHTTAGLTINEGADPAVQRDMLTFLDRLVPHDPYFTHKEGNSDAHIKSTLTGTSLTVFIMEGKLLLGTWQSIYLCEFDGPRPRKVALKIISC
uniref:YjbQ family protein n=1 Tax=Geobacter metallireducens TaxID=28232 RepID=A0A831XL71_GEOME